MAATVSCPDCRKTLSMPVDSGQVRVLCVGCGLVVRVRLQGGQATTVDRAPGEEPTRFAAPQPSPPPRAVSRAPVVEREVPSESGAPAWVWGLVGGATLVVTVVVIAALLRPRPKPEPEAATAQPPTTATPSPAPPRPSNPMLPSTPPRPKNPPQKEGAEPKAIPDWAQPSFSASPPGTFYTGSSPITALQCNGRTTGGSEPFLAIGDASGKVQFWEFANGSLAGPTLLESVGSQVRTIQWRLNRILLVVDRGSGTGVVYWRRGETTRNSVPGVGSLATVGAGVTTATGNVVSFKPTTSLSSPTQGATFDFRVTVLGLEARTGVVVAGGSDGKLGAWKRGAGGGQVSVPAHAGPVSVLVATARDPTVLSGGEDGKVRFWSIPELTPGATIEAHSGRVRAIALDPQGKRFATAGDDGFVRVWDMKTGARMGELSDDQKAGAPTGVAFAADNLLVIARGTQLHLREVAAP